MQKMNTIEESQSFLVQPQLQFDANLLKCKLNDSNLLKSETFSNILSYLDADEFGYKVYLLGAFGYRDVDDVNVGISVSVSLHPISPHPNTSSIGFFQTFLFNIQSE